MRTKFDLMKYIVINFITYYLLCTFLYNSQSQCIDITFNYSKRRENITFIYFYVYCVLITLAIIIGQVFIDYKCVIEVGSNINFTKLNDTIRNNLFSYL